MKAYKRSEKLFAEEQYAIIKSKVKIAHTACIGNFKEKDGERLERESKNT